MTRSFYENTLSVAFVTIDFVTIKKGFDVTTFQLASFLPFRLVRAAEAVSLQFASIYKKKYDLSRSEWRVLANLAEAGRATATDIATLSAMHKTKVSRAVFELEKRKWLARHTDMNDRRVEWLELTKTGFSKFSSLAVLAEQFEATLRDNIGNEPTRQLLVALDQLEKTILPQTRRKKLS